jgi:hypothetical protein
MLLTVSSRTIGAILGAAQKQDASPTNTDTFEPKGQKLYPMKRYAKQSLIYFNQRDRVTGSNDGDAKIHRHKPKILKWACWGPAMPGTNPEVGQPGDEDTLHTSLCIL